MSISFAMILFGALLIYAGWTNKSVAALARGDNSVSKPAVKAGAGSCARRHARSLVRVSSKS